MSTVRPTLRLGKRDEGRLVSSEEFAEAEFDEPWRYEREDGRLLVLAPSGEGHLKGTIPWRDQLIFNQHANPGLVQYVSTEAWLRVDGGTDRIGDLAIYLVTAEPVAEIPDRVPEMAFEIVSRGKRSRERDYVRKRADYFRFGVREYVIIDRFQQIVTVLTYEPGGYAERILKSGDRYESPLLPGFAIPIADVF